MTLGPALALGFAIGWVPLYLFRAEAADEAMPYYTPRERFWVRLTPVVLAAHVSVSCITLSLATAVPAWRAVLGAAIFAAGICFWLWARTMIGPMRATRLPDEPPRQLRNDGPFGLVRNPLYLGVLVAAAAPALTAGRPFLTATYLPCLIAIAVRAKQEERRLANQLGPVYETYCRNVKRLIPFVW